MIGERVLRDGSIGASGTIPVAPDLAYLRIAIVNVLFFGPRDAGERGWVLIDAGIPGSACSRLRTSIGPRGYRRAISAIAPPPTVGSGGG